MIETVDVGTAINPLTVKGQIEGGVCQGIGYALTESLEFNKEREKQIPLIFYPTAFLFLEICLIFMEKS